MGYMWSVATLLLGILGCCYSVGDSWKNICTNGRDAVLLNNRDYISEFTSGPCAPVMLGSGIGGSVLQIRIECEKLRLLDPDTFLGCGWVDCKAGSKLAPQAEYRVWVPPYSSPMSILSDISVEQNCWTNLMQPHFDNISGQVVPTARPGVKISPLGTTIETYRLSVSGCGLNATKNMIPGIVNPEYAAFFTDIQQRLIDMGYRPGLSVVAVPFDFRQNNGGDDFHELFSYSLGQLFKVTGKRTVIVGHSLANNRILTSLWKLNQNQKDQMIHSYAAVAPTWLGSAIPLVTLTCGNKDFYSDHYGLGVNYQHWKDSVGSWVSTFSLVPSSIYRYARLDSWMQAILKRIEYENGKTTDTGPINFIPTRDQVCYSDFTKKNCRSGLYDFDDFGKMPNGTTINNGNLRDFIDEKGYLRNFSSIWKLMDPRFNLDMPNPGVQVNILYSSVADTDAGYNFKADPQTYTNQSHLCPSSATQAITGQGDEIVPSTSAVTAGYKWALEFANNATNAKPVKLVELCSGINTKNTPYDGRDSHGQSVVKTNGYIGLPCDCSQGKIRHCGHNSMLFLPRLVDFLANTVQSNQAVGVPAFINSLTDDQLQAYVDQCKVLIETTPKTVEAETHVEPEVEVVTM